MSQRLLADVRSTRSRVDDLEIDGIVTLDHNHGQLVITFIDTKLDDPIQVFFDPSDPAAYPDENSFHVHTSANDMVVKAQLKQLEIYTLGQTVLEALRHVATGLKRALAKRIDIDQDGDTVMNEGTASADEPESGTDDVSGYSTDSESYEDPNPKSTKVPAKMARGVLDRIRRDLRKCREVGAKVGIFEGVVDEARTHTISLSIRARKLGISDEALEAWDVDPADYIVLLLQLDEPYPSAEQLTSKPVSAYSVDFRFGKCKKYKPSAESVRRVFAAERSTAVAAERSTAVSKPINTDDHAFHKLFLSDSLELFMKESFLAMFKLRLTRLPTWDAANTMIQDMQGLTSLPTGAEARGLAMPNGKGKEKASAFSDAHKHQTLPTILTWDSFAEKSADISMPLVALQFALHYFVRCTEYCVRCHRKVDKEFEALKPYVCENPLCLFQYITLGLGPSIEHEILTQPYVVDLLVTLCYSSISSGVYNGQVSMGAQPQPQQIQSSAYPIRTFPNGLQMKVPSLPSASSLPTYGYGHAMTAPTQVGYPSGLGVQGHQEVPGSGKFIAIVPIVLDSKISFSLKDQANVQQLTEGAWVVLRHPKNPQNPQVGGDHHAVIDSFDGIANHGTLKFQNEDSFRAEMGQVRAGIRSNHQYELELYPYIDDFDALDDHGKARSMKLILDTIPSVSQLREWLMRHPHNQLRTNPDISPSALRLLAWIVASNRSCILQVSHVEDYLAQDTQCLKSVKTREQEVIPGLGSNCVQFRFAMGSPDKELRFHRALKEQKAHMSAQSAAYPTLFAWHGSSLQNWHSILRHGLDYSKIMHGRAFGDGVYFSPAYQTSIGYAARASTGWPRSVLNPTAMLALCEIINCPSQFVSVTPHYVVSQLDWIQCRYLFVHTGTSNTGGKLPSAIDPSDVLLQDPARRVQGPHGALQIPRKAIQSRALVHGKPAGVTKSPKRSRDLDEFDDDTDEEDAKDLSGLFSEDESTAPSLKRFHPLTKPDSTRDSSVDSIAARQMTENRPPTPPKLSFEPSMTDFRPDTLDLKSIPQLEIPVWANGLSSKRLAADIKMMQKVQATTPLHELGWYIDFDNIENMFQWIVELHTFDPALPLAQDMKRVGITSVVLELRFGADYPMSPPFVRVIRPKFLPFMSGGGGHVTIGGAICMELLTNNGWNPTMSLEAVLVSIKAAISSRDPKPARLLPTKVGQDSGDYNPFEALEAFQRYARTHGWQVPKDAMASATQQYKAQ